MTLSRARRKIAVLMDYVDHLEGGYATEVRLGLETACVERDIDLLIFVGREVGATPHNLVYELVNEDCADAVVLLSSGLAALRGVPAVEELVRRYRGLPICSLGVALPGVPSVIADNRPGLSMLLDHLIVDHGKSKLAFLAGHEKNPDARARLGAYRDALERHGLRYDEARVVRGDAYDATTGARALLELLKRGVDFDAVVAGNDAGAVGALEILTEQGRQVPSEVALTGFDDLSLCRFTKPPLTTVRQPIAAMAAAAIELVCAELDGLPVPEVVTLPVEVVRRASCGCDLGTRSPSVERTPSPASPLAWLGERRGSLVSLLRDRVRPPGDQDWVPALVDALEGELAGNRGALASLLTELVTHGERDRTYDELQLALALLRDEFRGAGDGCEDLWSLAQRALANESAAQQVRRRIEVERAYTGLLRSAERLTNVFDLPSLKRALAAELPTLLKSAFVLLPVDGEKNELTLFFGMSDGRACDSRTARFPKTELLPGDVELSERRRTWLVLPLTFEQEPLGFALLEAPRSVAFFDILRTMVSSALKGVVLHQEILAKTAQHERSVQERLATAKRMSALSVLAGGVAHDLNNALGPLVALPDVMLGELYACGSAAPELAQDLVTIRAAALHAAQTIKDLLSLGRQGHTEHKPLDLGQLVSACFVSEASLRERAANSGIRITLDLCDEPLVIRGSEAQLSRAVSNLLRNAVEAIDASGAVTVSTHRERLLSPLVAYETVDAGEYAVLSVSDTGNGIAAADLGRVFEPFFTKKKLSESSGSGLGLAIVHGAVKEHAGFADVTSERGRGTRFSLYFPLADVEIGEKRAPSSVPRGFAHVLVIDDDPVQLRTALRVLTRFGYSVVTAASCRQGYELFRGAWEKLHRSGYDLVLVDMLLDEATDGLELFERFWAIEPAQRGIVVSGHAPTGRVELAVARGLPFLAKPYTADALGRAVRNALESRERASAGPNDERGSERKLKLVT